MSRYKFKQLLKVKTAKCMGADIFKNLLIVGLGSFLGGGARYLVSVAMSNIGKAFPWGTLTVNLVGCFVIGLLCGFFSRTANDGGALALFCTFGVCGGFTTFSTFSKEALLMLQAGNYWAFAIYIAVSVIVGILLTAAGYALSRGI